MAYDFKNIRVLVLEDSGAMRKLLRNTFLKKVAYLSTAEPQLNSWESFYGTVRS
jgi:hypothetical protein